MCENLNFLRVENIEISLYALEARQLLLLLLTLQGNIYNRLRFLNKYHVLRGIKRAIPRKLVKISDCRVSSLLKTVPHCRVYI